MSIISLQLHRGLGAKIPVRVREDSNRVSRREKREMGREKGEREREEEREKMVGRNVNGGWVRVPS